MIERMQPEEKTNDELFQEYKKSGDQRIKQELVMRYIYIVKNIAMQMKEQFYKLVALGLGTVYAFQVFLTIGGVTKFIPSTGVTLPLVSYGGSSLLATMMLFAVIQGLYILRQDEGENNARKKQRKTGYERQQVEELY